MKDPYAVLGLTRDADPELIKSTYGELKAKYSEQRFLAGEEGNDGARKLQELEEAWARISEDLDTVDKTRGASEGPDFARVDSLIREGKYNEAQDLLDSITERKGEWHYLQSIVFYKREWMTEAKTQLEMALQDDPGNPKYRASLDKLNIAINSMGARERTAESEYSQPNYEPSQQQQTAENMSNCLTSCCCAYCLTDCLCSAMRCL